MALVFFAIISMLVKSIFILTLNTVLSQLRRDGALTRTDFTVIWFFYLVVTELAPAVLVIVLFSSFKKVRVALKPRATSVLQFGNFL